jgi:hypothetical protein
MGRFSNHYSTNSSENLEKRNSHGEVRTSASSRRKRTRPPRADGDGGDSDCGPRRWGSDTSNHVNRAEGEAAICFILAFLNKIEKGTDRN